MSTTGGMARWRRPTVPLAALLDRPDVVLQVVPLGCVYVGLLQLTSSRGTRGIGGAVGFGLVVAFFVGCCVLLLRRPQWAGPRHAVLVMGVAPFATLAYGLCLVEPPRAFMWVWLVPQIIMLAAYLCRMAGLLVVAAITYVAGIAFITSSGVDLRREPWLALVLAVAWALPGVLTRRVIGTLRHAAQEVFEQTSRDPLTHVLNREGLDAGFRRLVARAADDDGAGDGSELAVMLVDLDGFKHISERFGAEAADAVLVRAAEALDRAHRRDHLVARLRADTFVVVATQPTEQLAPALLAGVRRSNERYGMTASIGAVDAIPLDAVPPDRLGSLLLLAEGQLATARDEGGDRAHTVTFDVRATLPGPVDIVPEPPDLPPELVEDAEEEGPDLTLFGTGLAVLAVLAVLVPQAQTVPAGRHLLMVSGAAALAAGGVLVAAGWLRHVVWQVLGIAVAFAVLALATGSAASPLGRAVGLVLVPYPAYLAALTLSMTTATVLLSLLPVAVLYALGRTATTFERPAAAFCGLLGFVLVSCALALWVRRLQARTTAHRLMLSRVDPGTGLLSREGLLEVYCRLPEGTPVGVVYLDVDDMAGINRAVGLHGGDTVLRRVGVALRECVGPEGIAARVGSDEFVLLLPGQATSAAVLRRLVERLGAEEVPVRMSVGQAFGTVEREPSLWRLMSRANEALLLNRARDRRPTARPARHPNPSH